MRDFKALTAQFVEIMRKFTPAETIIATESQIKNVNDALNLVLFSLAMQENVNLKTEIVKVVGKILYGHFLANGNKRLAFLYFVWYCGDNLKYDETFAKKWVEIAGLVNWNERENALIALVSENLKFNNTLTQITKPSADVISVLKYLANY